MWDLYSLYPIENKGPVMLSGTSEIIKDSKKFITERVAECKKGNGSDEYEYSYFQLVQYINGRRMHWDINDLDIPEKLTKHQEWLVDVCKYNNGRQKFTQYFNKLKESIRYCKTKA